MILRGFGSDNHAGVVPEVLDALARANAGHAHGYGDDEWTRAATNVLRRHFGDECDVSFVFNGTGANCVSFAATCRPWEAVVCAESAHVNTDECAAPERIGGVKLVPVATPDGKLTPELVRPYLRGFGFEHAVQPKIISISNVTELGTVYSPEETSALADLAHSHGMLLHVDGARLANAAVAAGCSLAALTSEAGVDVLSLGATKLGAMGAEAVLLFGDARTDLMPYVRKQSAQLASKMRFIAAQFSALFDSDLWFECAHNANFKAAQLVDGALRVGIELAYPAQANEVFALLAADRVAGLQERFGFYVWDETPDDQGRVVVRWVTAWDTTEADVAAFVEALSE